MALSRISGVGNSLRTGTKRPDLTSSHTMKWGSEIKPWPSRAARRIAVLRMSKRFRAWKIDEPLFLPPMVQDFVAEDHLARFVLSLVRDDIDLAAITGGYGSERGRPPPAPRPFGSFSAADVMRLEDQLCVPIRSGPWRCQHSRHAGHPSPHFRPTRVAVKIIAVRIWQSSHICLTRDSPDDA
jgi:hypothetical protein